MGGGSDQRGFTLLELLVVLAIVALAVTLVMPRAQGSNQRAALHAAGQHLAATLKSARAAVLRTSADQTVTLDLDRGAYWQDGEPKPHYLNRRIAITVSGDSFEQTPTTRRIRFRPDGSATGGVIGLKDGPNEVQIAIDWLTGAARMLER
jgi:general secretion pathway protein H